MYVYMMHLNGGAKTFADNIFVVLRCTTTPYMGKDM